MTNQQMAFGPGGSPHKLGGGSGISLINPANSGINNDVAGKTASLTNLKANPADTPKVEAPTAPLKPFGTGNTKAMNYMSTVLDGQDPTMMTLMNQQREERAAQSAALAGQQRQMAGIKGTSDEIAALQSKNSLRDIEAEQQAGMTNMALQLGTRRDQAAMNLSTLEDREIQRARDAYEVAIVDGDITNPEDRKVIQAAAAAAGYGNLTFEAMEDAQWAKKRVNSMSELTGWWALSGDGYYEKDAEGNIDYEAGMNRNLAKTDPAFQGAVADKYNADNRGQKDWNDLTPNEQDIILEKELSNLEWDENDDLALAVSEAKTDFFRDNTDLSPEEILQYEEMFDDAMYLAKYGVDIEYVEGKPVMSIGGIEFATSDIETQTDGSVYNPTTDQSTWTDGDVSYTAEYFDSEDSAYEYRTEVTDSNGNTKYYAVDAEGNIHGDVLSDVSETRLSNPNIMANVSNWLDGGGEGTYSFPISRGETANYTVKDGIITETVTSNATGNVIEEEKYKQDENGDIKKYSWEQMDAVKGVLDPSETPKTPVVVVDGDEKIDGVLISEMDSSTEPYILEQYFNSDYFSMDSSISKSIDYDILNGGDTPEYSDAIHKSFTRAKLDAKTNPPGSGGETPSTPSVIMQAVTSDSYPFSTDNQSDKRLETANSYDGLVEERERLIAAGASTVDIDEKIKQAEYYDPALTTQGFPESLNSGFSDNKRANLSPTTVGTFITDDAGKYEILTNRKDVSYDRGKKRDHGIWQTARDINTGEFVIIIPSGSAGTESNITIPQWYIDEVIKPLHDGDGTFKYRAKVV